MRVPENELTFEYQRSSGPGGQNVNKVATAVRLRFHVASSTALAPEVKERLLRLAGSGSRRPARFFLGQRYRTQEKNRTDVVERLDELVERASIAPKRRRPTRPTKAAGRRRLEEKRRRSSAAERSGRTD
ncbi:MAG: alternative ribosome rescue aminoacyl-tRNA hydrolase ArfB [Thermoanaerobaculia bacterium]